MNIFVANIERKVTDEQLQDLFSQHGEIASLKLIRDRDTGVSKGYAFVEMTNDDEAQKAIDALNEYELEGRALAVNEARPKTEYKKSSGGGGGGTTNPVVAVATKVATAAEAAVVTIKVVTAAEAAVATVATKKDTNLKHYIITKPSSNRRFFLCLNN